MGARKGKGPGIIQIVITLQRCGNLLGEPTCSWFGPAPVQVILALCWHPWGSQQRRGCRGEGSDGASESTAGGGF